MARGRLHKRYRRRRFRDNPAPRSNPPLLQDLVEFIGPGFAGFAATRFLTRMAMVQIAKRKPSWAPHAGAIASLASFFAAWFLAHRVKLLERFHTPLVVGSGIAAGQSLLQIYAPNKLGWLVSDASPEVYQLSAGAPDGSMPMIASGNGQSPLPAGAQATSDDPADYVYDDRYDAGIFGNGYSGGHRSPPPSSGPGGPAQQTDEDLLAELDLESQTQGVGGVFGGGFGN